MVFESRVLDSARRVVELYHKISFFRLCIPSIERTFQARVSFSKELLFYIFVLYFLFGPKCAAYVTIFEMSFIVFFLLLILYFLYFIVDIEVIFFYSGC